MQERRAGKIDEKTGSQTAAKKKRVKAEAARLLVRLLTAAVAVWVLFAKVFLVMQAPGNDMFPAVKDGDLLVGFRMQKEYQKKDVAIYEAGGKTRVGRVMAKGSDIVDLDGSGTLTVNGTPQNGEILFPTYTKEGIEYPLTVPEGYVFILGDYRTQTEDSRDFGCIPLKDIKAKVLTLLRRRAI